MEHHTAHTTTRSRQSRLFDTDDTGITGIICGEVTGKAQPVTCGTGVVAAILVGHLSRSRLSGHLEALRTRLTAQALTHHMLQNRLHGLDGLRLGDALLQHLGLKLPDHLSVLHQLFHEAGLHHLTVVGDGVVERYGIDGCDLRLVADTHPRQCGLTPIFRAVGGLRVRHTDIRRLVTHEGDLQVFVDTDAIEPLHILGRIAAVILIDEVTHTNIRTDLERTGHADGAIASTSPVVIFHRTAVHLHYTATCWDGHRGVDNPVVEGHEERGNLEHRSRLTTEADGAVHHFVVLSVEPPFHIHDGLDVARLHLHQDGDAHLTADLLQLVDDGVLRQVLHPYVDGGHNIGTVDGIQHGDIHILVQDLTTMHQTVGSTQDGVEGEFEAVLRAVLRTEHIADGALCQRTEGTAAGVILLPVEAAPVFRQREERQCLHLAERVVVDASGPDCPVAGTHTSVALYFLLSLHEILLELLYRT